MNCTQTKQLTRFPRVRIPKRWFRYFNDHKQFCNEGNLHLFSLMALFSYANFRSHTRHIGEQYFLEAWSVDLQTVCIAAYSSCPFKSAGT